MSEAHVITRPVDAAGPAAAASPLRRVGRRTLLLDSLVAVLLAGLVVANGYLFTLIAADAGLDSPTTLTFVSGVVMCLTLVLRRSYPLTVFVLVSVAFTVYGFNQGYDALGSSVVLFIATVSAGAYGRPVARDWARGIVIAGLFGTIFYAFYTADEQGMPLLAMWFGQVYSIALNIFYFAAAWILGDQLRLRRQRDADLAERAAELSARTVELEAERERSAEKAAVDERLRIARELHDVLGHHVSVIGVQAGAARRILEQDPDQAGEALRAIEGSSRQAVAELQRVLQLLRDDDQGDNRPPGALERLDELADEVRRAGVAVTVQVDALPPLPVEVDLAAVRVIQESLTNVLRHAGPGTSTWVKVRAGNAAIEVEVGDDGKGQPLVDHREGDGSGVSRGSGLRGMRERVEVHGGAFEAGPLTPRGWRVRASIPLPQSGAVDAAPAPWSAGASASGGDGETVHNATSS